MAGRPVEAMTLIGLGIRSLSMAPASVGPVKAMILSMDVGKVTDKVENLLKAGSENVRDELENFAESQGIELEN